MNFFLGLIFISFKVAVGADLSDCDRIWRRIESGGFHEKRDLSDYEETLGSQFFDSVRALKPNESWLDAGSGQTHAVTDYLESNPTGGHAVAVTIKPITENPERIDYWAQNQQRLKMFVGQDFNKIEKPELGQPKVISDFFGVISYTAEPDRVLQTYLDVLAPGGEIFIHTDLGHTQIVSKSSAQPLTLLQWMRAIPGVQVESVRPGTFKITKAQTSIEVPKLELVSIQDDQPPKRIFKQKN